MTPPAAPGPDRGHPQDPDRGLHSPDGPDSPPATRLSRLKAGRTVSVCLPARDEAATIGQIVATIVGELVEATPLVDEVLVVDDGSTDDTAGVARAAGARVVAVDDVLPGEDVGRGKGQAMWKAVAATGGDLVVFCDADVTNFAPHFVTRLLEPLLAGEAVAMVKGFYDRPLRGTDGEGGRVTELMARPLIATLFPQLGGIPQPLAGECAGRRDVFEVLPFAYGYGVELGLLVDVAARYGAAAMAQADLGLRVHRNRPLSELGPQALAVLQVALQRAGAAAAPAGGMPTCLVRAGREPVVVTPGWCPPLVEVAAYRQMAAGRGPRPSPDLGG